MNTIEHLTREEWLARSKTGQRVGIEKNNELWTFPAPKGGIQAYLVNLRAIDVGEGTAVLVPRALENERPRDPSHKPPPAKNWALVKEFFGAAALVAVVLCTIAWLVL